MKTLIISLFLLPLLQSNMSFSMEIDGDTQEAIIEGYKITEDDIYGDGYDEDRAIEEEMIFINQSIPILFDGRNKGLRTVPLQIEANKENIFTIDLSNIKHIGINRNEFTTFPEGLLACHNLRILLLSYIDLENIPQDIHLMHNLETLELSHNKIKSIPKKLGDIKSLKMLLLNHNQITEVPATLKNLTNLTNFRLNNNKIDKLPDDLFEHTCKSLYYYHLPLIELKSFPLL